MESSGHVLKSGVVESCGRFTFEQTVDDASYARVEAPIYVTTSMNEGEVFSFSTISPRFVFMCFVDLRHPVFKLLEFIFPWLVRMINFKGIF